MKEKFIDFKAFRTRHHLEEAIMSLCQGRRGAGKSLAGICPRQFCAHKSYRTMKAVKSAPVAYCHACATSFDALQIVADSMNVGLRVAAEWLEEQFGK